jgi:hypothetical protein
VSDLPVGPAADATVALEDLDRFDDIDVDAPLPIEARGVTDLPTGRTVALALNGTIAGLGDVGTGGRDGQFVLSLLMPRLFEDGTNELRAYLVDGPVGEETIAPLEVGERG